MIEGWRRAGAEIVAFSPLADEAPDPQADAVFLPGGYPELHAGRLASNHAFLDGLRGAAARGAVVYGECGGYMALGRTLTDAAGRRRTPWPACCRSRPALPRAGSRLVIERLSSPARLLWARAGTAYRGHEFHYATVTGEGDSPLFEAQRRAATAPRRHRRLPRHGHGLLRPSRRL